MKKILFIAACFSFVSACAQTADEIIKKYADNMGGLDSFNKVKTIKFTATFSTQGVDLPMTIQTINNRASRSDIETPTTTIIRAYKDGKGWTQNALAGINSPKEVTGTELIDYKAGCSLANSLMDYKARGHLAELQGQETVEGVKAWKIKLTSKDDGRVTTYFIGVADNVLLKSAVDRDLRGTLTTVETWYSNLKTFGGLKFFMTRDSKIDGETFQTATFNTVELNVTIDEKIFDMPK